MATVAAPMATEELLALLHDGMECWLIAKELRERRRACCWCGWSIPRIAP